MVVTVYATNIAHYLEMLNWIETYIGDEGVDWDNDYTTMSSEPGARDWGRIEIKDEKKALWFQLIWG